MLFIHLGNLVGPFDSLTNDHSNIESENFALADREQNSSRTLFMVCGGEYQSTTFISLQRYIGSAQRSDFTSYWI
jgi:hypothetical protein